jgi:hypothetical protein
VVRAPVHEYDLMAISEYPCQLSGSDQASAPTSKDYDPVTRISDWCGCLAVQIPQTYLLQPLLVLKALSGQLPAEP